MSTSISISIKVKDPSQDAINKGIDFLLKCKPGDYDGSYYAREGKVSKSPNSCFKKEVLSKDLITYKELAERFFISEGVPIPEDQGWLEFEVEGKTLFISKKYVRHSISWATLYNAGIVAGDNKNFIHPIGIDRVEQNKRILINGKQYIVRLLKGCDPTIDKHHGRIDKINSHSLNSEWAKTFKKIITDGIYSPDELFIDKDFLYGSITWCQEVVFDSYRVLTGSRNLSYLSWQPIIYTHQDYGWRPCLELVE